MTGYDRFTYDRFTDKINGPIIVLISILIKIHRS